MSPLYLHWLQYHQLCKNFNICLTVRKLQNDEVYTLWNWLIVNAHTCDNRSTGRLRSIDAIPISPRASPRPSTIAINK